MNISCSGIVSSPSFPVVLLLFIITCAQMGITKTFGLYLNDIIDSFNTTPTAAGIELGLYIAFTFLPGPIVIALNRRQIFRRVLLIVGSCFVPLGVILTSLATDDVQIAIFLPLSGLGICIIAQCGILTLRSLASSYFNILYSVAMCGVGVGMVLLPFVAESLRVTYGWRGGLLILGGLTANLIPCAVAVRLGTTVEDTQTSALVDDDENDVEGDGQLQMSAGLHRQNDDDQTYEENLCTTSLSGDGLTVDDMETVPCIKSHTGSVNWRDEKKEVGNNQQSVFGKITMNLRKFDCYSDPIFSLIFVNAILFGQIYSGWHAFLVPHVLQRGISIEQTIIITFCASLGNITGRILAGALSNNLLKAITLFLLATVVNIAALLVDVFVPYYYVMLLTSFLSAASIAMRAVLASAIILKERATPENFDIAIATFGFIYGLGLLFGGYLSGLVAEFYSSYDATFKLLAGLDTLVFVSMLPPRFIKKPSS